MGTGETVIGYVRVSTAEQSASGASPAAQTVQIEQECARRGWTLLRVEQDVQSGKSLHKRRGLERALASVEKKEARAIVVAKLDRLSRSLVDFASLVERSRKKGWELVALDLGIDTTTPNGEAMAGMLAVFAQWERRMIGQRTKDGLAVKKSEGVRLGRPKQMDEKLRARMRRQRKAGWSYHLIAKELNTDSVPTVHGGRKWYPATVKAAIG